jgi:cytochrome c oxidase assembly protein Cox11
MAGGKRVHPVLYIADCDSFDEAKLQDLFTIPSEYTLISIDSR